MSIDENVRDLLDRIASACDHAGRSPDEVTLVAVTKTVEPSAIEAAFNAGVRHFGENRVQEARPKIEQLRHVRDQITWHMVGHVQTNKAKTATGIFDIIHSVDSLRLADALNDGTRRKLPILLQVNVAEEPTKSGFSVAEVEGAAARIGRLSNLAVEGLMTIAPWVSDPEEVRPVFSRLRQLRDALGLTHLSMGMTGDLEVAVEEGATLVRVGQAIFGERSYGMRTGQ